MARTPRRAAAWLDPIYFPNRFARKVAKPDGKQTHKLMPIRCVLWLPDYGAYLKSVNLSAKTFTVSSSPDTALRLAEDIAEDTGHALVEAVGVRVHLRPFRDGLAVALN